MLIHKLAMGFSSFSLLLSLLPAMWLNQIQLALSYEKGPRFCPDRKSIFEIIQTSLGSMPAATILVSLMGIKPSI